MKSQALRLSILALGFLGSLFDVSSANAQLDDRPVQTAGLRPALLRDVGLDQNLGSDIPLDLAFRDEHGHTVALQEFFGQKPVILTLVYYQCPMLCTEVLNGLLRSAKELPLEIGKDFTIVTVSIDPTERPILANVKHELYTGLYGRPGGAQGWHFLTGDKAQIKMLAQAAGFRYAYDSASGQFAHPSGIVLLTHAGKLVRYFYGISYPSRDLRLGLLEASQERIGSPIDQILLYCYHYDPATGKYGLLISRVVKAAGALTVLSLGLVIAILFRREKYGLPRRDA
ncbi:MAG: SCO family protein [Acidobacteria bacterium]|nr:MAG: SCO family protein [Acidobacteriota bacterium]